MGGKIVTGDALPFILGVTGRGDDADIEPPINLYAD
jgi:hypothetical protein